MVACGVGVVHYRSSIAVVSYHMRVCSLLARSGIVRRFDFWSNLGLLQSGQTIGTISSFEVYPSNMDRLDWASWVVCIPVDVPLRFVQKFKTAGPAAEMIRHMEKTRVVLSDCDAVVRHAVTCGDGAYVGPYSNNLVPTWAAQATRAGISGWRLGPSWNNLRWARRAICLGSVRASFTFCKLLAGRSRGIVGS
jgi:hypothetical protein